MSATQLAYACWAVTTEYDEEVHHKNQADCMYENASTPQILPAPCIEVTCDECGYAHDEYGDHVRHFATLDEAKTEVLDAGWREVSGQYYCPADDCVEAAGVPQ